jgi:predicted MFS family arabinose efflux permease
MLPLSSYLHLHGQPDDVVSPTPVTTYESDVADDVDSPSMDSSDVFRGGYRNKRQRRRAVALFSVCTVLLFADQNLMSPNLSAIADDFGFDALQRDKKLGGDIALAFFVLGAPASFVVGSLADSFNRPKLFAWTVGIGEGACLATYWTTTYPQLYVCRAVTGFSLGGALPLIYSVLGDLFAADERHSVSAVVGIGTGLGISLGQAIAGFLGPAFGWRLPFLVVSIPALLCAAGVLLAVDDPERGSMEEAVRGQQLGILQANDNTASSVEMTPFELTDTEQTMLSEVNPGTDDSATNPSTKGLQAHWMTFKTLLSTPTFVLMLMQGAPGCLPWGVINSYLNDFLSENRGMSVEFATLTILIFGVGNFLGLILGGGGGMYLYRRDKRYPALLAGSMAVAACFPLWVLLNDVDSSSSFLKIGSVSIFAGITSGSTGPIVKATLQNVTLPQSRGQAFALFNTFDDFGRGLGPVFVAMLIERMGGRTPAFNVGVLGWMVCGVLNLCVFWTVAVDEGQMQSRLTSSLRRRRSEQSSVDDSDRVIV